MVPQSGLRPLVSVIIPCRNAAPWLAAAIESCLRQSWDNLEIIVVDNGSSDASFAVADRFRGQSVSIAECARPGASAARNIGLQRAHGEFIQFLDADDLLHPDKIAVQVERLATMPANAVASGAWGRFRGTPETASFTPEAVWRDFAAAADFLIASWLGGGMMPVFAWLTPRAVIDAAGPWNESLSLNDDGEFFCRVLSASSGVAFCGEARGYYRSAVPTLSRRRDRDALASGLAAIELGSERLLARCHTPAAVQACATQYQRFAYDAYPDAPDLAAYAEQRALSLGGSDLPPPGGRRFAMLSRCIGWKAARRCQSAWQRLGVRQPAGTTSPP